MLKPKTPCLEPYSLSRDRLSVSNFTSGWYRFKFVNDSFVIRSSKVLPRARTSVFIQPYTFNSFTPLRHSQTHLERQHLGHTPFTIYRDKRVCSAPRFQLRISPFIHYLLLFLQASCTKSWRIVWFCLSLCIIAMQR